MRKDNLDMYMISEIFSLNRGVCIGVNAERRTPLDRYMISEIFSLKRCVCIGVNAERQFGHVHDFRDFFS